MHYDNGYKHEAVELAKEIGVKNASAELGLSYSTIYGWYAKSIRAGQNIYNSDGTTYVLSPEMKDKRISELEKKNSELMRANEILEEALSFFAACRKR